MCRFETNITIQIVRSVMCRFEANITIADC